MHRADSGAGQHGDGELGDHREIDRDAVAGVHADGFERVGELADALVEFGVGELEAGTVFGLP